MINSIDTYVVGLSVLSFFVLKTYLAARKVWKQLGTIPGRCTLFSADNLLGRATGPVKYITAGGNKDWRERHREYKAHGWDIISSVGWLPSPNGSLCVADAQAIKAILSSRSRFPMDLKRLRLFECFGKNVVVTDFDDWKRHRRTAAPAFTVRSNRLAINDSVRVITSLYEGPWRDKQEIIVEDTLDITITAALMSVSVSIFGRQINWEGDEPLPGHKLTFKQSVQAVNDGLNIKMVCPDWLFKWAPTKDIRETRDAFAEFQSHLSEMVNERNLSGDEGEKRDLLSYLMSASEEFLVDGQRRLSEEELFANIFMFYIAGKETTGTTLCSTLNMLALHNEEQEALYQHIQDALPDGRLPTHEDIPRLNRVTATLYETMRMFPAGPIILRRSAEDTTLVIGNEAGETAVFPVPAGTGVTIGVAALHYNPRYWKDPYTFKPERFMGEWNKDAFIPFSGGGRKCPGRGFFETTGPAMLTTLIQRYKVEPHPKFAGESFEQLMERYSQTVLNVSLTPVCSSLVFKRRN